EEINDIEDQRVAVEVDKLHGEELGEQTQMELQARLDELNISLTEAQARLDTMMGLDGLDPQSELYRRRRALIEHKFERLDYFRSLNLNEQASFRNDKRALINRLIRGLEGDHGSNMTAEEILGRDWTAETNFDEDYATSANEDPFKRFMFMGEMDDVTAMQRILDYRIERARSEGDTGDEADFSFLQSADFTESPLTPDFSFDMLRNDGLEDHQSGLPSRTFVGPLTFVFNTNGSSLRPTDILNENFCTTAYCEVPKMIGGVQADGSFSEGQGVPPERVEHAFRLDINDDGDVVTFGSDTASPVYDSGDSVNATYENNKYYGYLKAYYNKTVDQLIEEKKVIDAKYERTMEAGSQVIHFTKTMNLKYALLDESDERSHYRDVDMNCATDINRTMDQISDECYDDIHTRSKEVIRTDDLMAQLNNRQARIETALDVTNGFFTDELTSLHHEYDTVEGDVTKDEIKSIMEHGWKSPRVAPEVSRKLFHRMCFVLAQNFFTDQYFEKTVSLWRRLRTGFSDQNEVAVARLEKLCHDYTHNLYDHNMNGVRDMFLGADTSKRPVGGHFAPIIFERKVRTYNTTDRYVYRGGKSLNINVSTSFNLSNST
ncbi:MAG: hypothetical protein HRT44_13165, partial [Bdellovibrionales bacterium]|nr:hypothetical protein [Bdellovibrionales bacterium]NQZ20188.1 hypothetical protein [Bdellovibrionales bacterium]